MHLPAGQTVTLAEIDGPGTIRHIWLTVADRTEHGPFVLRDLVLRAYWDGSDTPSIEVPLGDFFCNGFATRALITSIPVVVAPTGGMNCYFPMPFRQSARITVESQHPGDVPALFYQIDYTTGEALSSETPYFHAHWRHSDGTAPLGTDHVIVDDVSGRGTYVGTYIALTSLHRYWWGEGEVKFFLDEDDELPTLCSTGLEDYAGGAWAFQDELRSTPEPDIVTFSAPYCGYPFHSTRDQTQASPFSTEALPMHGLYRWHLPDPIHFEQRLKVTLQQIGAWDHDLFERQDDIATTAYWYQTLPHTPFQQLPPARQRWPR